MVKTSEEREIIYIYTYTYIHIINLFVGRDTAAAGQLGIVPCQMPPEFLDLAAVRWEARRPHISQSHGFASQRKTREIDGNPQSSAKTINGIRLPHVPNV